MGSWLTSTVWCHYNAVNFLRNIHKRHLIGSLQRQGTVYPKKYAHGFVVLCFVVVMLSFIMNSHEVFIHIHQGCFAGTGAIVRLPQCQWSKPDGYGKISQCITTTKQKPCAYFLGYTVWGVLCGSSSWLLFVSVPVVIYVISNNIVTCYNGTQLYILLQIVSLHWCPNDHDGVSNHQPHGCLLNHLFRCRSKTRLNSTQSVGNMPPPPSLFTPTRSPDNAQKPQIWPISAKGSS